MAQKITSDQLNKDTFSGAIDANGWSPELKANGKKVYRKRGATYIQLDANATGVFTISSNIPVGYTSVNDFYVTGYVGHNESTAISLSLRCDPASSIVRANGQNRLSSWQGGTASWSLELTEI